jgi:YVTN family beta-propeller protein
MTDDSAHGARVLAATFLSLIIFAGIAGGTKSPPAPKPSSPKLYVADTQGDDLAVIDASTLKLIRQTPVGLNPHGAVASPDGRTLYVTIEGTNELVALNTADDTVTRRVPVGRSPNEPTVTVDGRYVFVPIRNEAAVDVVDTQSFKVIDRIPVPAMPHNTYTSADGRHIYVGSMSGQRITVIDAATRKVVSEISPGNWVRPIAIKRDESLAYTALSNLHGFVVVDLHAGKVIKTIELPPLPPGTPRPYLDTYTHGLALSPDENELYCTSMPGNAIHVFRLPALERVARIVVGRDPNWIVFRRDGRFAFVSNTTDNSVSCIDTASRKVTATIPVGHAPKRLVIVEPGTKSEVQ